MLRDEFYTKLDNYLRAQYGKTPDVADIYELHNGISRCILEFTQDRVIASYAHQKAVKNAFILSAEYLPGVSVIEDMRALNLTAVISSVMADCGYTLEDLAKIEEMKLGRSAEGRYAISLLEAAATCGYPVHGYGLRYQYGYFKQEIAGGFQLESADDWACHGDPWTVRREEETVLVKFRGQTVKAVPYDMPVFGHNTENVSVLRLWKSEPEKAFDWALFQSGEFAKAVAEREKAEALTMLLYPQTTTIEGKKLYLKQAYFLASASVQDILNRYKAVYDRDFSHLEDFCAIQLNDTFPVLAIPELIRLLMENGLEFVPSFYIAKNIFGYTNYIVAKEEEPWHDMALISQMMPELYYVILMINEHLIREFSSRQIPIGQIRELKVVSTMRLSFLKLAMYSCGSICGISMDADQKTGSSALGDWHLLYPKRFQNIVGGLSQRQWLTFANKDLSALITKELGGNDWVTNLPLVKALAKKADDPKVLQAFRTTKNLQKRRFAAYLEELQGLRFNPDFLLDVHVKHICSGERQLLNIFGILWIYHALKDGELADFSPTTFLIGGKAEPGDFYAKAVLKYIWEIGGLINNDPAVADKIRVVFVENPTVNLRERLVPAAELNMQLPLLMSEGKSINNLQYLLNGGISLSASGGSPSFTEGVYQKSNFIFGTPGEKSANYDPKTLYRTDPRIARIVDSLVDGTVTDGAVGMFSLIYNRLLDGDDCHAPDDYFVLRDLAEFVEKRLQANRLYADKEAFDRCGFSNILFVADYSADRTIADYGDKIWGIHPSEHPIQK